MKDFGLYIVMTSPLLGYHNFAQICVDEEVPLLQLREKTLQDRELLCLTKQLVAITKGSQTRLIINNRVDICLLANADGVHLGPDDLTWQEARMILPHNYIIGVSTHSLPQAAQLTEEAKKSWEPDYMSFGPIYRTVAKAVPDLPVGVAQLHQVITDAIIPVVAIGGIFPSNISEILSTGARNLGMIRHFGSSSSQQELRDKIREIKQTMQEVR